jgi:hypothetical protein
LNSGGVRRGGRSARGRAPSARSFGASFAARALACLTLVAIAALAGAAGASASTDDIIAPSDPDNPQADSGWQAGTCKADPCSVDTSTLFYERAAGHPPFGFTQFIVEFEEGVVGDEQPVGELKTVRVDLPPGLTVNPQATPQCKQSDFEKTPTPQCPPGSEVGTSFITGSALGVPAPAPLTATVYNIEPPFGEPARFGFNLAGNNVYLRADVAWEGDYHEGFTIDVPEAPKLEPLLEGLILKNRLVFRGNDGDGTFITTPTTCLGEATSTSPFNHVYSTWLLASSIEEEEQPGYAFPASAQPPLESRIPPDTSPKDCESIPFEPSITVDPRTAQTDSPSGAAVTVQLPEIKNPLKDEKSQSTSHVRSAQVTLPAGMGLNPSAATGLQACDDSQFHKGSRAPVDCPPASRIGTVHVDTPPLPDGSLSGPVYVGRQLSRDPTSGEEYRIFVVVESARYGISARLLGKVRANPQTGQLTTTFDDAALGRVPLPGLPQVPFSSFRMEFNEGARAPLTSPPTCGPNVTGSRFVPWSAAQGTGPAGSDEGPSTDPPAAPGASFGLSALPGGGSCPKTLASRPFAPGFGAGTVKPKAATFSPLRMDLARADGSQELKGLDVTLPPGLTAKLAGVRYCPESALAAAAANGGIAEAAASSCPASSLIGHAEHRSGSGPSPVQISGKVFLAGPYKGAPLSLAVVTPATAGPFDLGTVVSRVALFVDPRTAQVRAVADPIPHVFGGALLDLRSVAVKIDRPRFSLNPTNCSPFAFAGALLGGGANPLDPAAFSTAPVSAPFQASGCDALQFKPKLFLRLFGATRRAKNPRLRAVLLPRSDDANIARAATILPRSLILDQGNLSKVCTRVQFAAHDCPKNSIYGYARAFSPLLDGPLKGPLYLRSSDNVLPDLVAALQGQVDIELSSRTDSVRGRIRSTFDVVPDVPVSKFILTLRGGPKGLLVNSRNQCPRKRGRGRDTGAAGSAAASGTAAASKRRRPKGQRVIVRFKAQNGKKLNRRLKLRVPCGKKRHR